MAALEDFEEELSLLLQEWHHLEIEIDRLRSRTDEIGAVETAREYVRRDTGGFEEAYRRRGETKTFEYLILRYSELFDAQTLDLAQAKLREVAKKLY